MAKRAFDIAVSATALIVLAPLFAVVALLVRWKLGRPVLHRAKRPGLNERLFTMVKFRSMTDATDASGELLPDEARIVSFGAWLRRTSLDELPELWNVLKGDMSLVGPRPLLTQYLPLYSPQQRRRHLVRPGVTGWAQINGRNAISWDQKFALDLWYVDNRSFRLDLWILARTFVAIVRRDGVSAPGHATMPIFLGNTAPSATPDDVNSPGDQPAGGNRG